MTTEEQHELVTTHRWVAESLAARAMTKYRVPESMRDELKSAAVLGLVEAASRFDPAKGTQFTTWAFRRIQGSIVDELRSSGREILEEAEAVSELPSPEEQAAMAETARSLRRAVQRLPQRERDVLQGHYLEGRDLNEIASDMGCVKSSVARYKARALDRLRKRLGREPER